ncbi:MAG: magnesium transporter [Bacillota bacterium]|nr:magnesium transporter [Bacillota bacterium]
MLGNKDRYENLFAEVLESIDTGNKDRTIELILDSHMADVSKIFEDLEHEDKLKFLELLDDEHAAYVLTCLSSDEFFEFFSPLGLERKVGILDYVADDDIADILGEAPEHLKERLMKLMDEDEAKEVKELMSYEEDTAGGIMTKDFLNLEANMKIQDAMDYLREYAPDAETVYYLYVTDKEGKLVGIVSLRELIIARPDQKVADIMNEKVIFARVDTDQEEVAAMVRDYDFLIMPVVDANDVLVGIITVDDVMDIVEEEMTEDILKFAGTTEYDFEMYEDKVFSSVSYSVKSRLPWLIITIFGGVLSSFVVAKFEHVLSLDTAIALFMPLLAGMGGNVGTQSSTLTVRSLALRDMRGKEVGILILQEVLVGLTVGVICALIIAFVSLAVSGKAILSLVVAISMFANISTAAIIGTAVPLVFKKIGVDPAVASAPFITTTVDITGLFIYFSLALLLISKMN